METGEISSAMASGLAGMQTGMQSLNQNASDIARAPVAEQNGEPDRVVEALVESKEDLNQVQASANVVEAASGNLGTILDITV